MKKNRVAAVLLIFVMLVGIFSMGAKAEGDPIQLATKPMTEQFIISEMLKLVIEENTGYTVEITKGIGGGTGNIQPAMEKGDFDMYPEYTSTGWQYVLKHEEIPAEEELFEQLTAEYAENYGFEWVGMYGFSDTFGMVVRKELADEYGLETYSDLAPVSGELIFGAEYDFYEREDGYDNLCATYGLEFKKEVDLDIGLKYQAINSGQIDVMDMFTTDGQLATAEVKVLKDDKNYFLNAYCGTVVRADTLEEYPGLKEALLIMEGQVSTEEMTQLNYEVEIEQKEDKEVARQFLVSKGIIEEG